MSCIWLKESQVINGRNPLLKDENVIDYDMDSEEEFEEEHGEDIMSDKEDEDDDMGEDDEEEGFIVPDGYLSNSEKNDDDLDLNEGDPKAQDGLKSKRKRKLDTVIEPTVTMFSSTNNSDLEDYKIFTFKPVIMFPLEIRDKDFDDKSDEDDKKDRMDPNAINNKIKEFIMMVHGSYETKCKIIDDFSTQHPE
jgi:hypothetical protein